MFYRELIITTEPRDSQFFMNQIFALIHEKYHQLPVVLAFPQWTDGRPNQVEGFSPRVNRASMGSVLRLFSEDKEALESAVTIWGVQELVEKRVIYVTPVCVAPVTTKQVAFYRDRAQDTAVYRTKVGRTGGADAADKLMAGAHQLAYFPVVSSSGNQLSMFIGRAEGVESTPGAVSSYGLSNKSAPKFVPDF